MNKNPYSGRTGILIQKEANIIRKELVRKSIHLATAFVPLLLKYFYYYVILALTTVLVCYVIAEFFRYKGKKIVFFSFFTEVAARKRDENRFVLGPVTLAIGVILSALLFDEKSAAIAIYALAFGDGLASLAGKLFGKHEIPFCHGKTLEGSFTCFAAICISTYAVTQKALVSLIIAFFGTVIEVLPIKDFDNLIIPLILGFIAQVYFHI